MKKLQSLSFNAAGVQTLPVGTIQIPDFKRMVGLGVKMTVPVKNTTGGALAMPDSTRQKLLGLFTYDVKYGPGQMHNPFTALKGDKMNWLYRQMFGSEYLLYADSTTGFATSMANNATTSLKCWTTIPLGRLWWLDAKEAKLMGMGPTQARSLWLQVQLGALNIDTGWDINPGNVTLDFYPILEDSHARDVYGKVPYYRENDDTKIEIETVAGLPLAAYERTAVNASTSLTSISVQVGDTLIHNQVPPTDLVQEFLNMPLPPAASILTDRETIVYLPAETVASLADLPSGLLKIRQDVKDLATFKWGVLYVPPTQEGEAAAVAAYAANPSKSTEGAKRVKVVDLATHEGLHHSLPPKLAPYLGWAIVGEDDPAFESQSGFLSDKGQPATLAVPASQLASIQKKTAALKAGGAHAAAERLVTELQARTPGTITGHGGPSGNTSTSGRAVRALFPHG
jgi:hypothetical protein